VGLEGEAARPDATDALREILTLVRLRTGHDFTMYKRATLFRRIARRMQVTESATLDGYHRYLRDHPAELAHLLRDFLISVTNFLRDGDAFAALANDIVPRLFAGKGPNDQLRVWIAGCASGEEAYSFGILLLEHAQTLSAPPRIQLFATDIDERALAEARLGCYPDAIVADLSPERLQRFFMRENNQYRVVKELRELVLFSPHNVLRDPPFSRLDLVSCRNLLIYLNRDAQRRVLTMFHFGLRPEGLLFLGSSESAETSALFGVLDPRHRVFQRKAVPATLGDTINAPARWQPPVPAAHGYHPPDRSASVGELHHRIVESYAPPSALIDPELDVVHLSEHAGRFLQLGGGELTRQVLRLVHPGIQLELRTAIYAARRNGSERRVVRYEEQGEPRVVELFVRTVDLPELGRGSMIVTFDEQKPVDPTDAGPPPASPTIEPVVRELEDELLRTREQLRTSIEQYETSLEELKASNEELQAINEELRSATEELETSKEELQSVNEELTTLNHELKSKVDEVSSANSDLQNLMASTEIGVIFLDRRLDIKRFTPRANDVFNLIPSDLGRPLAHITHRLVDAELVENAQAVLQTLRTVEKRVRSIDGRSYLARWLPYRSVDDRIEGVVVTVIDVTDLRDAVEARLRSENALEAVEERLRVALESAPIVVFSFDTYARLTWAYVEGNERTPDQLDLHHLFEPEPAGRLQTVIHQVMRNRRGERLELPIRLAGTVRTFDFGVEPSPHGVTIVGFDISASKRAEAVLRDADVRKDEFLATLSHELRNPLGPLQLALELARMVDHDPKQRADNLAVMDRQV
ncbi:MAG: CheR family methyltransferase, partial [Kofleriaceae bacterium]